MQNQQDDAIIDVDLQQQQQQQLGSDDLLPITTSSQGQQQQFSNTSYFFFVCLGISLFAFITTSIALILYLASDDEMPDFQIHGHQGAKALHPENSLEGFKKAVELGLHAVTIDISVTGDRQLIASYDTFINPQLCDYYSVQTNSTNSSSSTNSSTNAFSEDEAKQKFNLYNMTLSEIHQFDCGSKFHPHFPRQEKVLTRKPLLTQVIELIEAEVAEHKNYKLYYVLNLRSFGASTDSVLHPVPEEFTAMVKRVISDKGISRKVIIQSGDLRVLHAMKQLDSSIPVSLLVDGQVDYIGIVKNLNFGIQYISIDFNFVTEQIANYMKQSDIKLVPHIVNDEEEMKKLSKMGVSGIITDNVDSAMELYKRAEI